MGYTNCTAATLRAILCYIDPTHTPKIAFDKDGYASILIDKITQAVGDKDGSQSATVSFGPEEAELQRQFLGVCQNIQSVFKSMVFVNSDT